MTTAARGSPVTGADVEQALGRIRRHVRHTPLEHSPALSERLQTDVYLKMECWQVTGSFKPRISFSKLLMLSAAERERGVIASTAGGHGIGLALRLGEAGNPCAASPAHLRSPTRSR